MEHYEDLRPREKTALGGHSDISLPFPLWDSSRPLWKSPRSSRAGPVLPVGTGRLWEGPPWTLTCLSREGGVGTSVENPVSVAYHLLARNDACFSVSGLQQAL